ncbi:hypothetical protein [Mycobacterium saskatchewanense]|nr:hypothetical protein [Mycobacterium saskatchewanense]
MGDIYPRRGELRRGFAAGELRVRAIRTGPGKSPVRWPALLRAPP